MRPNEDAIAHSYKKADALWAQADEAWKSRPEIRWAAEVQAEVLEQARDTYQGEKEALEQRGLGRTTLGKLAVGASLFEKDPQLANNIDKQAATSLAKVKGLLEQNEQFIPADANWLETAANLTEGAALAAGCINAPFVNVGGVLKAGSTALRIINRRQEESGVRAATKDLKTAVKNTRSSIQSAQAADEQAHALEQQAAEEEERVRILYQEESIKLAQLIKPPASLEAVEWNKWIKNLARASKITQRNWMPTDLESFNKTVASIWRERIDIADQVIKNIQSRFLP